MSEKGYALPFLRNRESIFITPKHARIYNSKHNTNIIAGWYIWNNDNTTLELNRYDTMEAVEKALND
jgi:hypothetical protein